MSEFWIFTTSGAIVAWAPLAVGFVVSHWRLRVYIDRRTTNQTGDIQTITREQTGTIKTLTAQQTAALLRPRRARRRARDTRYDDC